MIGAKPLRIRFDIIDGFLRVYDGIRYLVLRLKTMISFYNRIKYLVGVKGSITYVFCHNHGRIKVDSHDSLTLEKTFTLLNIIILIKSVLNKDQNYFYNNTFLEKSS